MSTRLSNPYIVGTPLSGEHGFYGRKDTLRFVLDTLAVKTQNVIVLYGQRRIGKTSLLHQLIKRDDERFHAVLFDLQGKGREGLSAMLVDLATTIARSLSLIAPDPATFDSNPNSFRDDFLPQIYAELGKKRLLLLFDEFDVLGDEPSSPDNQADDDLLAFLQKLVAEEQSLAYVFVIGRRIDELPLHYRSLFKQAIFRRLSIMQPQETVQLITRPAAGVLDYAPDAIKAIVSLTSGHPYLTQLLCHVIYKQLADTDLKTVRAVDVTASLDEAMEMGTGGLDWFWESLPRAERMLLSALANVLQPNGKIAHQIGNNGQPQPIAEEDDLLEALSRHRVRLLDVELTNARQRLLEWEIIAQEQNGYRFRIDLVRRWIAREHPLDRAQQDIDLIGQRATRYFNNARDAHLAGDLKLAIEDYKRALAVSPNHFDARLGLGQSLQDSNDLLAAIVEYEKAYRLDPAAARDELLSARLALGIAHQHRGDLKSAINELERILELAPEDEEAQNRLISVSLQSGEVDLVEGHYTAALEHFNRAIVLSPDDQSLVKRIKEVVYRYSKDAEARDEWDAALESLSRLAEHMPEDKEIQFWVEESRSKWRAQNYYEMALRAQIVGDPLTTIEECRRTLEVNPSHAQARLLLASMLHQIDDISNAIDEYEEAYRLDPDSSVSGLAQARLQRAAVYESQDKLESAVTDYERALEVHADATAARERLPVIWMRWADDHLAANDLDSAFNVFQKALGATRHFPQLAELITSKIVNYSQDQRAAGEWEAAVAVITRLRKDLGLQNSETNAWFVDIAMQRGEAALDRLRYADAVHAFKEVLLVAAESDDASAIVTRIKSNFIAHADAHLGTQQPNNAIDALTALIETIGDDEDTLERLAHAWCARGDMDVESDHLVEAEQAYQRALELQPDSTEILSSLTAITERRRTVEIESLRAEAERYAAHKDWDKAQTLYKQLLFKYFDEESRQALISVSEEIRMGELFELAHALHTEESWEAAITTWLEICHTRSDYVSDEGLSAPILLAEAIEQHAGIAAERSQTFTQLKRRIQLAWILVTLFGIATLGELIYILSNTLP